MGELELALNYILCPSSESHTEVLLKTVKLPNPPLLGACSPFPWPWPPLRFLVGPPVSVPACCQRLCIYWMRSITAFAHILLQAGHDLLLSLLWLLFPRSPPMLLGLAGSMCLTPVAGPPLPQATGLQFCRQSSFHADLLWFFSDLQVTHVYVKMCGLQVSQSCQIFLCAKVVNCLWTEIGKPWREEYHLGDQPRFRVTMLNWGVFLVVYASKD